MIGKGGEMIKKVQEESGAKVSVWCDLGCRINKMINLNLYITQTENHTWLYWLVWCDCDGWF